MVGTRATSLPHLDDDAVVEVRHAILGVVTVLINDTNLTPHEACAGLVSAAAYFLAMGIMTGELADTDAVRHYFDAALSRKLTDSNTLSLVELVETVLDGFDSLPDSEEVES